MMENLNNKFKNENEEEIYFAGDVLKVEWDRGNGAIQSEFFYYGINPFDGKPLLFDLKNFGRKPAVFFDQEDKIQMVSCTLRYSPFYANHF